MFLHGRRLDIYRTFENLSCGSNVATHCWLLSLEEEYKENGKLPDTLYHQVRIHDSIHYCYYCASIHPYSSYHCYFLLWKVDGGSENTAKAALAICELLVARRLTRRVVLTRLLVGHTHEDIDAIFALIWQYLKNKKALTPQTYAKLVALACRSKAPKVDVKDIWAVPDYQSYFNGFINPKLGRYAKGYLLLTVMCFKLKWLMCTCIEIYREMVTVANNFRSC